jgi:hypothetical protein
VYRREETKVITSTVTLTQEDLDGEQCATPGCTENHSVLFINSICHPTRPIEAAYYKADGTLRVRCVRCGRPVAVFQVARRSDGVVQ